MTDETLINNFLEKNFKVITGQADFMISDKLADEIGGRTYNTFEFIEMFKRVIGDFTTDDFNTSTVEIFHIWYGMKKRILTKKLLNHFDLMDGELGSIILNRNVIENLKNEGFHNMFISNYFNDYYSKNFIEPHLEKYVNNFDVKYDSSKLIDGISYLLSKENAFQYEFALKYLNEWYCNVVLTDKVNDLLSQLVITLGKTNWNVTWIGHGPLTNDTLRNCFKKENSLAFGHVKGLYEEWYDREVIDKSERMMKSKHDWEIIQIISNPLSNNHLTMGSYFDKSE